MGKNDKKVAKVIPVRPGNEIAGKKKTRCPLLSPKRETGRISTISGNTNQPKNEFIELITHNLKSMGFDEISSKILAFLLIETEEMSLEEIAIETGYSLSAISTAMKNLSQYHILKRFTKPGSKKAFFILEKDFVPLYSQMLLMKSENILSPSKKALPDIIKKYELIDSETSEDELDIVKNYYRQTLKLESIIEKFLDEIENINNESK